MSILEWTQKAKKSHWRIQEYRAQVNDAGLVMEDATEVWKLLSPFLRK
jgi:hypothetical protein